MDPNKSLEALQKDLAWERRDDAPRCEYYSNDFMDSYTYGKGAGRRTYESKPYHEEILKIRTKLQEISSTVFEVCFLNRYLNQSDWLGWHSDDSPEMDDERPIGIVSLGVEREIWFRSKNEPQNIIKHKLENGSLCLMLPGMQDSFQHRIPKASFLCGERISLTFRGYIRKV